MEASANQFAIFIGVLFLVGGIWGTHVGAGIVVFKPLYPIPRRLRIVLASFGIFFVAFGLIKIAVG